MDRRRALTQGSGEEKGRKAAEERATCLESELARLKAELERRKG